LTTLSAGKLWGLRRLADERGLFRMLAVDQRPPISNRLRQLSGAGRDADVSAVERLLVEERAPAPAPLRVSDPARPAPGSGRPRLPLGLSGGAIRGACAYRAIGL